MSPLSSHFSCQLFKLRHRASQRQHMLQLCFTPLCNGVLKDISSDTRRAFAVLADRTESGQTVATRHQEGWHHRMCHCDRGNGSRVARGQNTNSWRFRQCFSHWRQASGQCTVLTSGGRHNTRQHAHPTRACPYNAVWSDCRSTACVTLSSNLTK